MADGAISRRLILFSVILVLSSQYYSLSCHQDLPALDSLYTSQELSKPTIFTKKSINSQRRMPFNKTTGLLNHTQKLSKFIVLLNYGILAQYIIMSGDISTNPGPLDFRCPNNNRGISFSLPVECSTTNEQQV